MNVNVKLLVLVSSSCEEQKLDASQETDDFERVQKHFGPGETER